MPADTDFSSLNRFKRCINAVDFRKFLTVVSECKFCFYVFLFVCYFCINCIIVFLGRMLVLFISLFVLALSLVVLTYIAQLYVLCLS